MPLLEVACFNTESALIAQSAGADRIELCDGITIGGTTPNLLSLQDVRNKTETTMAIPVFVMIRPRGGNFVYSAEEFEHMKSDILRFKSHANGFVFGILDLDNEVDVVRNLELVTLAEPLPCTFHRAFDAVGDLYQALEVVVRCGFKTILTSGGAPNAIEGAEQLGKLVEMACGRIQIMPGGGVRSSNIEELSTVAHASFYHSSAIVDKGSLADTEEVNQLKRLIKDSRQLKWRI